MDLFLINEGSCSVGKRNDRKIDLKIKKKFINVKLYFLKVDFFIK